MINNHCKCVEFIYIQINYIIQLEQIHFNLFQLFENNLLFIIIYSILKFLISFILSKTKTSINIKYIYIYKYMHSCKLKSQVIHLIKTFKMR